MSPLGDAVHSMCSTYRKKNFRACSFKIYQWNMCKLSLKKQSIVDICMESPQREFVASYSMKTSTHIKNHCLLMSYEVTICKLQKKSCANRCDAMYISLVFFSFIFLLFGSKVHAKCTHCIQARLATSFNTICHTMMLCKAFEVNTLPVLSLG